MKSFIVTLLAATAFGAMAADVSASLPAKTAVETETLSTGIVKKANVKHHKSRAPKKEHAKTTSLIKSSHKSHRHAG